MGVSYWASWVWMGPLLRGGSDRRPRRLVRPRLGFGSHSIAVKSVVYSITPIAIRLMVWVSLPSLNLFRGLHDGSIRIRFVHCRPGRPTPLAASRSSMQNGHVDARQAAGACCNVREIVEVKRILRFAIVERFTHSADGELEPSVEGAMQPVAEMRMDAGIRRVKRYAFYL